MDLNKIFLDTNIVVDIIQATRPNHKQSVKLLELLILNDCEICISEDILTTLFYILKDKISTLRFLEEVVFIDWIILTFGKSILENGVSLALEKNLDLEDLLQCLCAKENGCDVFITNDKKFYDCSMNIMTSKVFYLKYSEA